MKGTTRRQQAAALLLLTTLGPSAQSQPSPTVCPDPSAPCRSPAKTFAPYELSFRLPRALRPNTDYKSTPFYAVVLKTLPLTDTDACDQGEYSSHLERERCQVQAGFPRRKVFADHQCPNMAAVSYLMDGKLNTGSFLAVYGGTTRSQSEPVLATLKRRYPNATLKRMQVIFQRIVQ